MFTVQVLYENDKKPAKNKKVAIGVDGLFGGSSREEWTDENGRATIDLTDKKYVNGKIYVNGTVKYQGEVGRFMTVLIQHFAIR